MLNVPPTATPTSPPAVMFRFSWCVGKVLVIPKWPKHTAVRRRLPSSSAGTPPHTRAARAFFVVIIEKTSAWLAGAQIQEP